MHVPDHHLRGSSSGVPSVATGTAEDTRMALRDIPLLALALYSCLLPGREYWPEDVMTIMLAVGPTKTLVHSPRQLAEIRSPSSTRARLPRVRGVLV